MNSSAMVLNFLWLLLFAQICSLKKSSQDEVVDYYKKLINSRMKEGMKNDVHRNNKYFMGAKTDLNRNPIDFGEYDFIIVGAGSSGTILARRLTEVEHWNVLLIEAGGREDDFTDIPNMLLVSEGLNYTNWGYYTTPQKTCCLGMKDKKCNYPRGKIIGGSGTINALMYVRGNRLDYDRWGEKNPGWSYKEVLPYFKRSEDVDGKVKIDPGYHGFGGLWHVDYAIPPHPTLKAFIDGSNVFGIPELDYNGRRQLGVAKVQINTKHGKRQSGGRAFLDSAKDRDNLKIQTKSLAVRIVIDQNNSAYGIHFIHNGVLYEATAKKEVIVSGGTINTPQLLMLSGIGPKDHLESLGIENIANLPVGKHLREHPTFFGITFDTNHTNPVVSLEDNIKQYLAGVGAFTNPGNSQGIGYVQTTTRSSPKDYPDIEYVFIPPESISPFSTIQYNFNKENNKHYLAKIKTRRMPRVYTALLHPRSSGSVTLSSKDPFIFPNIDLNMFSDYGGNDLETMYEGVQILLKIAQTEPFKRFNTKLLDAPLPACNQFPYLSKDYWKCSILQLTGTFYHPTGTARMGPKGTDSVVDNKLKVHGIDNLRVVDCSVIINQPSGHTNAIAVMIGEKGADLIKIEHGELGDH